ncbi:MAG TPA: ribosome silencing factor [Candidatus Marinimicrobia bacterium]|nr:ribosome silencing factor [Candidatus Neomarinimicrobiota bacterium]
MTFDPELAESKSHAIALAAAEAMLLKRAENIVILDMRKLVAYTDYFVICHGNADIHVKAIADTVEDSLLQYGEKYLNKEGYENRKWILLDYVDVIVHIFDKESRDFYDLEYLWADASRQEILDLQ